MPKIGGFMLSFEDKNSTGWDGWIRTIITGSKVRRPAIGRHPNAKREDYIINLKKQIKTAN